MYDLIFLDIEMPEINGMEVATTLRRQGYAGHIVFTTNHTKFMPDAFKVKAFRFLEKPVADSVFKETLEEAEKEIMNHDTILVDTTAGTRLLSIRDIIYLETIRNYTYIHTKQGEIETRKTLSEWMHMLGDDHFYRVNRSYVVALQYVEAIGIDGIALKYVNGTIPIPKKKTKEIKAAFLLM